MEHKETAKVLAVGTPAPNFSLVSAHGPEITLEEYRGQRNVVLWFSKGLY
jgi:peroxiredoxin